MFLHDADVHTRAVLQVGAVIVGGNKVVLGIGYNGFPRYVHFKIMRLPCLCT